MNQNEQEEADLSRLKQVIDIQKFLGILYSGKKLRVHRDSWHEHSPFRRNVFRNKKLLEEVGQVRKKIVCTKEFLSTNPKEFWTKEDRENYEFVTLHMEDYPDESEGLTKGISYEIVGG